MSTHAFIGIYNPDIKIMRYVYCHSDGYPSYLGRMLFEHYNTPKLASELVALGDLSMVRERLAPDSGEEHTFKNPVREGPKGGVTTAYHRDRNEPLCFFEVSISTDTLAKEYLYSELKDRSIPHAYLYSLTDCKWYAANSLDSIGFVELDQAYINTHI